MANSFTPSDVVAGLAFLLSGYATWKTIQFNNRQKSLIESQEKLNRRLLEKEDAESMIDKKADLGANIIRLGSNSYRLKIFNKGKAVARNVNIEFPEGNDLVIDSEVSDKFPLEALESYQSVELIAAVHNGTRRKHAVKLLWSDDFNNLNEKIAYPTL